MVISACRRGRTNERESEPDERRRRNSCTENRGGKKQKARDRREEEASQRPSSYGAKPRRWDTPTLVVACELRFPSPWACGWKVSETSHHIICSLLLFSFMFVMPLVALGFGGPLNSQRGLGTGVEVWAPIVSLAWSDGFWRTVWSCGSVWGAGIGELRWARVWVLCGVMVMAMS